MLTEDGNPRSVERRLRALGIRTWVFKARQIRDLPKEIRAMGRMLGIEAVADRKAGGIETRIREIETQCKRASGTKIRKAIFIFQPSPLIVAGRGTNVDDAFKILGIENIAASGTTRYPKYSLEEIIRLHPDALFFGKGNGMEERIKPLMQRLSTLDAVRAGRVYFISDAVYRLGPRIISALEEMAACREIR
jgi:iron complex transport system substrate-binding protein